MPTCGNCKGMIEAWTRFLVVPGTNCIQTDKIWVRGHVRKLYYIIWEWNFHSTHSQSSLFAIIHLIHGCILLSTRRLHVASLICGHQTWVSKTSKLGGALHAKQAKLNIFTRFRNSQPFPVCLGVRQNRHLPKVGGAASRGPGGLDPNPVLSDCRHRSLRP